ncbi:MAG: YtxH domain-containing protein [Acidobacteria bacterium]|nr:YtxH domain-containing protein [Acidobacteriota bacterium]
MSNHDNASGQVLLAFVLGAVAGAAVALLYAPSSGEETRRRIADKAREGREKAESAARDGRDFLHRQCENLNAAVERGRETFEQVRKETL